MSGYRLLLTMAITAGSVLMLMTGCNRDLAGATTETTNGVTGTLCNDNGTPAVNTVVRLYNADHDPVADTMVDTQYADTTDTAGTFGFNNIVAGTYALLARNGVSSTGCFIGDIDVVRDSVTTLAAAVLDTPGAIVASFSAGVQPDSGSYVYLPGTDLFSFVRSNGEASIANVPAGIFATVIVADAFGEKRNMLRDEITVNPDDTTVLVNPLWRYSRKIVLNTSPGGADVAGDVYGFPVLLRLTGENFDFSTAHPDGRDLLFTGGGSRSLAFEIGWWDAAAQEAAVWVTVDTVHGNDSVQSITMFWGNPDAESSSNGAAVFDTAAGFQGVWHLDESGNDSAHDATANRFDGTAYHLKESAVTDGAIGGARLFDGDSGYLTMPNTAGGNLNFKEDGSFTVSAWVYIDTFDNVYRTIVSKGFRQYFLQLSIFPGDEPLWQFSVFREDDNWNMSHTQATEKQWVLLTGIRKGTEQYLYCNGEQVAATSAVYPQGVTRDTSEDLSIGRFLKEATFPDDFGYCYFKGGIDEVRISSVARSVDWIRLCYMNQRSDDKLVLFK